MALGLGKTNIPTIRIASHDEVSKDFNGSLHGATLIDYPQKSIDGQEVKAGLVLDQSKIALSYELLNPPQEEAITQGDEQDGQKGRLNNQHMVC